MLQCSSYLGLKVSDPIMYTYATYLRCSSYSGRKVLDPIMYYILYVLSCILSAIYVTITVPVMMMSITLMMLILMMIHSLMILEIMQSLNQDEMTMQQTKISGQIILFND